MIKDPTSQSNFSQISSRHVEFKWNIDWDKRILTGVASHTLIANQDAVELVVFDTLDLKIIGVSVGGHNAEFKLGTRHPVLGSSLSLSIPSINSGDKVQVDIQYETTSDGTALQWLEKEQTAGKEFPYLFSQCQPIYARSLAPLQDSSSAKITWNATVMSKLPVLLSAVRISPPSAGPPHNGKEIGKDGVQYSYKQSVPIPSYLIAIASGNVRFRAFESVPGKDWSTGVWAEPELIDSAHWEFSEDTPKFMVKAEEINIPYKFGVYEMVVLPPAFPYGGMENACLTFLTPTLLSGDRALVDVVAHELQHSWFGNGVTQANSSHFWLNEGWTTYMERMLLEVLHGPEARMFAFLQDFKSLQDALKQYEKTPKYQRLVIDFEFGEDPDDAYSKVAYEKGANFLLYLERILGGVDVFLPYAKDYVTTFIGKSITTQDWKDHLYKYFGKSDSSKIAVLDGVDWNAWFFGEGIELPVKLEYPTTLADKALDLALRWRNTRESSPDSSAFKITDVQDFNTNQIIVFIEQLQSYEPLTAAWVMHLGAVYKFDKTMNVEIRSRYYELALASSAANDVIAEVAKWVVDDEFKSGGVKGRMKFCRPIFRALGKTDMELARGTFTKYQQRFHPIARRLIQKDLGII